jgi:hypothetical protein
MTTTRPEIRVYIAGGPRDGETLLLDVESKDRPPPEIILPDHRATRAEDGSVPKPAHAVTRYRLAGPDDRGGYKYQAVLHDE